VDLSEITLNQTVQPLIKIGDIAAKNREQASRCKRPLTMRDINSDCNLHNAAKPPKLKSGSFTVNIHETNNTSHLKKSAQAVIPHSFSSYFLILQAKSLSHISERTANVLTAALSSNRTNLTTERQQGSHD
jgi:hypothetical protein